MRMRWYPAVTNPGEAMRVFSCDVPKNSRSRSGSCRAQFSSSISNGESVFEPKEPLHCSVYRMSLLETLAASPLLLASSVLHFCHPKDCTSSFLSPPFLTNALHIHNVEIWLCDIIFISPSKICTSVLPHHPVARETPPPPSPQPPNSRSQMSMVHGFTIIRYCFSPIDPSFKYLLTKNSSNFPSICFLLSTYLAL